MGKVIVIGGGAGGYFTAICIKEQQPDAEVVILEKTSKVLQKVKVSGGGRCNVTNGRTLPAELVKFYPRGGKKLHKLFQGFTTADMRQWLAQHGVKTSEEADRRVFPASNSSQTIIDLFEGLCRKLGVQVKLGVAVQSLEKTETGWLITHSAGADAADAVVMATGASGAAWQILEKLGLKIQPPVPSLFTFHIDDPRLSGLSGMAFPEVQVKMAGTSLTESGPMLITHWGLSGPAVLKLSAWGARELAEKSYRFGLIVNLVGKSADGFRAELQQLAQEHPGRKVANYPHEGVPKRYWQQLLSMAGLSERTFGELGKAAINKLTEELTQAHFQVTGKSAFKEEFVTCGGVDLAEVDLTSFQSKRFPGLYLVGEVLDIDALTGGFNFQACWSGGWAVAQHIFH